MSLGLVRRKENLRHPVEQRHLAGRQPALAASPASGWDAISVVFIVVGWALTSFAYMSLLPGFAALLCVALGNLLLHAPGIGGPRERHIFNRVFATASLAVAVASVYAQFLDDTGQLYSDAFSFYESSANLLAGMTLEAQRQAGEGSLAIMIWSKFYDFFGTIGFAREIYIGVLVNLLLVSFTAVVTLKMARLAFGDEAHRLGRLTLLFSTSGLVWLFASIHLRDSFVLFANVLLMLAWAYYLAKPQAIWRVILIVVVSLLSTTVLSYLRTDFIYVPLAIALAGIVAIVFSRDKRHGVFGYFIAAVCFGVGIVLVGEYGAMAEEAIVYHSTSYNALRGTEDLNASLGLGVGSRLSSAILPVRVLWHSIHLFLFPVPVWSGFQLTSAYFVFKSLNVLFFYAVLPLFGIVAWDIVRRRIRSPIVIFCGFVAAGMTAAIAASSTETRHIGSFLPAFFIVALAPDLRLASEWIRYKKLLTILLCGMAFVHVVWVWRVL